MKTCGQCKHRWMECCLKDKRERLTVEAADEACESFELHLGKLDEAFEASLEKARRKHPAFVPLPPFHWGNQLLYEARQYKWKVQDGKGELQEVLLSECYEFMSALAVGDFNAALAEAGDIIAVMYRALNGECKKEESK